MHSQAERSVAALTDRDGPQAAQPVAIRWTDTEGAGRYLDMSVRSLEHLRRVGGGPKFAKAGRKVRYRLDWLDAWLEGRSFGSTSEARANKCP